MKKSANVSGILTKDDKKNTKSELSSSQPLNQSLTLIQNEPQSNHNQSRSNKQGYKKEMANQSQSNHEIYLPPDVSNKFKPEVTDSKSLEMLDQLLDEVPSPNNKKRRAPTQKDKLDSNQLKNDQSEEI